jgi:hypothetical protein
MHLAKPRRLKISKGLKRPAARLTGSVNPALSRPFISLEKMGVSGTWRGNQLLCKNLTGNYWVRPIIYYKVERVIQDD